MLKIPDLIIMAVYFAVMIFIGLWSSLRSQTSDEYFLGGRRLPTWALALSVLAAKISSVTFLALPAAAYVLDWRMFAPNLSIIPIALLAIWIVVPFFRRSAHTTAFEYLNLRFGSSARLYGAIIFLIGQALRLGAVIYLVSIPVEMFTGLPPVVIMLVIGGFCTLYTIFGGIQAVVWTDVIQAFILYIGGIAALWVMVAGIPGGFSEIFQVAMEHKKFSLGLPTWDMGERTFWTMLIIGTTGWISQYTSDQVLIQRYLMAKNLRQARMAGLTSAVLCLPTWAFFFFLGTTLFVFYKVVPDDAVASLPADEIFPHFILTRLPVGLVGLVIAGVLSAAMGALSAALNAFATVATVDIIKPYLLKDRPDATYTRIARWFTALAAIIMLILGVFFSQTTKESFVDLSSQIFGMIGGVLPGFFLLGFFAPRVNQRVLWQAFVFVLLANIYLVAAALGWLPHIQGVAMHPYWISTLMTFAMIVLALVLALIQKPEPETRPGLTIFSSTE